MSNVRLKGWISRYSPYLFCPTIFKGPNLPFLTRHPCGHCRQPTVWLCCCIGWYLTPFCTSTHVLCVQILKANGWMTCHCWLTIAHRYRSAFGAASLLIMLLHGTRVLGQQGRSIRGVTRTTSANRGRAQQRGRWGASVDDPQWSSQAIKHARGDVKSRGRLPGQHRHAPWVETG